MVVSLVVVWGRALWVSRALVVRVSSLGVIGLLPIWTWVESGL